MFCLAFVVTISSDSFSVSNMQRARRLLQQKNNIIQKANLDWAKTRGEITKLLNDYQRNVGKLVAAHNLQVGNHPTFAVKGVPHKNKVRRIRRALR